MTVIAADKKKIIEKAGFWSLFITLFLVSFYRSWSLYTLGFCLSMGLVLWSLDYINILNQFLKRWFLILPPLLYFFIIVISSVFLGFNYSLVETRLMFLLVPVFGFPVIISDYSRSKLAILFTGFILGIMIISIFLLIRICCMLYIDFNDYPDKIPFLTWINAYQFRYSSSGFSIFEHPTYLALKINWVLIILLFFGGLHRFSNRLIFLIIIILILSVTLLIAASKSGLLIWFILVIVFLIKKIKTVVKPILYYFLIPGFIILSIMTVMKIQRFERFVITLQTDLSSGQVDWKDFDQRTREWYSAVQIIKEKPITGFGLAKVDERRVLEYRKHGWEEEAALNLNAHNQFLEAQMTFGIAGSLSLLWMLLTPLVFRKQFKYPQMAVSLVLLMSYFMLFESMLNRQWGIMFFILFYCLLVFNVKNTKNTFILPNNSITE